MSQTAISDTSAYSLPLPKLPPLLLGKFNANNFYDWMHTAQQLLASRRSIVKQLEGFHDRLKFKNQK